MCVSFIYIYMCVYMRMIYIYIYMHVCVCVNNYIYNIFTYIYIYTYIYINIYTYIYIYKYVCTNYAHIPLGSQMFSCLGFHQVQWSPQRPVVVSGSWRFNCCRVRNSPRSQVSPGKNHGLRERTGRFKSGVEV